MTTTYRPTLSRIIVASLTALACGAPSVTEGGDGEGLTFLWYGGATYAATGVPGFEGGDLTGDMFAVALPDSLGGVILAAFDPRDEHVGDLFVLELHDLTEGVLRPCGIDGGARCHGRVFVGIDIRTLEASGGHWEFIGGTVELWTVAPGRVAGSFDNLLLPLEGDAAEERLLTDGTFDLPWMRESGGVAAMRCILQRARGASAC